MIRMNSSYYGYSPRQKDERLVKREEELMKDNAPKTLEEPPMEPIVLKTPAPTPAPAPVPARTAASAPASCTAPEGTQSDTTPAPPANPNVPTPTYDNSFVELLPSDGDGMVTITLNDGTTTQFEYPSFEDFFNDVILKDFIKSAQLIQKNFSPYRSLSIKSFGAPLAFISMDSNNNVVVSDNSCKDLCAYVDWLIKEDFLNVNETQENGQGYNKYLTMLNISEEEARNMTPEMAKTKLNEFYKKIGDGEKDANGNYTVPVAKYYTYISECYFDSRFYNSELENNGGGEIHPKDALGSMYAAYCADKFNKEMKDYYNKNGYVRAYTTASKLQEGYLTVNNGFSQRDYSQFPDVIFTLLKSDQEGQKVAQMVLKAAGVKATDDEKTVRNLLLQFGKQFRVASTYDNSNDDVDVYLVNAYLNANGYNNPALYDANFKIPEFLIPKNVGKDIPDSFDYSGLDRINANISDVYASNNNWKGLYEDVCCVAPQMHDYIKEALIKSGESYDEKMVERFLDYYITQSIELAIDKSNTSRPKTLEEIIEHVKSQIDKELAGKNSFQIETAAEFKEILFGTREDLLVAQDKRLKGFLKALEDPSKGGTIWGYDSFDIYSEYQAIELKELYPNLTNKQISEILANAEHYAFERQAEEADVKETFGWGLNIYRDYCLAEADKIIASLSPDEPPEVEKPPVVEPDSEPDIPTWKVRMEETAKDNGYVETDITGKYTYTDDSGIEYVCIWDPMNNEFMLFKTKSPDKTQEPEFTEDDKTLEPTVEGFYGEAIIAASKDGYSTTSDFGIFEKDGKLYEYDIDKESFIEYNAQEAYNEKFDKNDIAIKRTLANIYTEAYLKAMMLGYDMTTRFGIFEKDGVLYEYDVDTHSFKKHT